MADDKISIAMAVPPGITAAYAYLAACKAFGFDRDEGIDLELFYGIEPDSTARSLCAGECDVACLNTMVGLVGRDRGLPMIAVASKARRTHRWFAVVPDSPIAALSNLRGKRIACDFAHLTTLGESALFEEGVRADEITWVPWQGSGMAAGEMVAPLRAGEIDAVFVIDWNDGDFGAEGLRLRHLQSRLLDRIRVLVLLDDRSGPCRKRRGCGARGAGGGQEPGVRVCQPGGDGRVDVGLCARNPAPVYTGGADSAARPGDPRSLPRTDAD